MANDPRKRQKKLERRSAKRKQKKQMLVREQNMGLAERLSAAVKYPVLHCWIGDAIADSGIGWVVLSRSLPNGSVAVVNFLVDSYCLGVKDVFVEIRPHSEYADKYLRKMRGRMFFHDSAPAEARKLIEEAVAYARGIGLSPHADYAKAMILFGDIKATDSDAHFEFGKDGMPLFVSGPNDSPERCKQIVAILNNTCGAGRFHYLISTGHFQGVTMFDDDDDDGEYLEYLDDES
jgi:hypothetical protein